MRDANPLTSRNRSARRSGIRASLATALVVTGGLAVAAPSGTAAAVADHDWLGIVNTYRAMSDLDPVSSNSTWSSEGQAHSCYMLQNGISHDEIPGNPGYTPGGDVAGNSGNVAVSSSMSANARNHIDLWMTGPFHAIGILRHNLRTSGFGLCQSSTTSPWRSAGTLDVIRGIDHTVPRPSEPTLFPGDGATVPLHSFITEFPNPMTMCGWTGSAGLPLIAMMPADAAWANSSLQGPNGPIETCTLHEGNVNDSLARSILDADNAVIVMPRAPLADGTYTATVSSGGGNVTWSFSVDRSAPLQVVQDPEPEPIDTSINGVDSKFTAVAPFRKVDSRINRGTSRLRAGKVTRIKIADADATAVSANFAVAGPSGPGFLTAYNCTDELPLVGTLTYAARLVASNQAVVPLDKGYICLYSKADTHVIIDINGYFSPTGSDAYDAAKASRLYDSRGAGNQRLRAGAELRLKVAGSGLKAPADTTSVALNVAVAQPSGGGHLQLYPCGSPTGTDVASLNYGPGETKSNSVIVPVDGSGRICVRSLVDTHVIIDFLGHFSPEAEFDFLPLDSIRLFDSRSKLPTLNESTGGNRVNAGRVVRLQVAGARGIPADAVAASVNVTSARPAASSFATAFPCGTVPEATTVNIAWYQGAATNGALVELSPKGELCIYTLAASHLVVDINGVFS